MDMDRINETVANCPWHNEGQSWTLAQFIAWLKATLTSDLDHDLQLGSDAECTRPNAEIEVDTLVEAEPDIELDDVVIRQHTGTQHQIVEL